MKINYILVVFLENMWVIYCIYLLFGVGMILLGGWGVVCRKGGRIGCRDIGFLNLCFWVNMKSIFFKKIILYCS